MLPNVPGRRTHLAVVPVGLPCDLRILRLPHELADSNIVGSAMSFVLRQLPCGYLRVSSGNFVNQHFVCHVCPSTDLSQIHVMLLSPLAFLRSVLCPFFFSLLKTLACHDRQKPENPFRSVKKECRLRVELRRLRSGREPM